MTEKLHKNSLQRQQSTEILIIHSEGIIHGDVGRKDGSIRPGDAVAGVTGPVLQPVAHVVVANDAVGRHVVGSGEHRHYIVAGAVFLWIVEGLGVRV